MSEKNVVIVDACRTAFAKRGGSLKGFSASDLGAFCIKDLLSKTGIQEKSAVDTVVSGMAFLDTKSKLPSRFVTQLAGLPFEVSSPYIEMQDGSALAALNHAVWRIQSGMSEVAVVVGMESNSNRPAVFATDTPAYCNMPPMPVKPRFTPNAERDIPMAISNDILAKQWNITKEECDEFAFSSYEKYKKAVSSGFIGDEITKVIIPATRKTPEICFAEDEAKYSFESLDEISKIESAYDGGVTSYGNASALADGAGAMLVMSEEKANELGYKPLAKWVIGSHTGVREDWAGIAASRAMVKTLSAAKLEAKDMDVWECNEDFAAQNLAVIKDIKDLLDYSVAMDKWNPNGGAIAAGHPNAASGIRNIIFAVKQLEKLGGKYACIASACGGGSGVSVILENMRK